MVLSFNELGIKMKKVFKFIRDAFNEGRRPINPERFWK